jgi:hypothetical protein
VCVCVCVYDLLTCVLTGGLIVAYCRCGSRGQSMTSQVLRLSTGSAFRFVGGGQWVAATGLLVWCVYEFLF